MIDVIKAVRRRTVEMDIKKHEGVDRPVTDADLDKSAHKGKMYIEGMMSESLKEDAWVLSQCLYPPPLHPSAYVFIYLSTSSGLAVALSLGELPSNIYQSFYDAGAHRYLLRIETSNPELYTKLHPR